MLDHLVTVNPQVDRPAHINITRKVVSERHTVLVCLPRRDRRQVEAAVINRLTCKQGKSVNGLVGICRGSLCKIHLPGESRRIGRILVHK